MGTCTLRNIGVGIVAVLLPKLCVPLLFVHAETGCCNEVVGVGMCWSADLAVKG